MENPTLAGSSLLYDNKITLKCDFATEDIDDDYKRVIRDSQNWDDMVSRLDEETTKEIVRLQKVLDSFSVQDYKQSSNNKSLLTLVDGQKCKPKSGWKMLFKLRPPKYKKTAKIRRSKSLLQNEPQPIIITNNIQNLPKINTQWEEEKKIYDDENYLLEDLSPTFGIDLQNPYYFDDDKDKKRESMISEANSSNLPRLTELKYKILNPDIISAGSQKPEEEREIYRDDSRLSAKSYMKNYHTYRDPHQQNQINKVGKVSSTKKKDLIKSLKTKFSKGIGYMKETIHIRSGRISQEMPDEYHLILNEEETVNALSKSLTN